MTITNEPGYYQDGEFGIRIEDMHVVAKVRVPAVGPPLQTPASPTAFPPHQREGGFLGFDNYTFVPIQMKLVDRALLGPEELQYLRDYAARIRDEVLPRVRESGDEEAVQWVLQETEI